VLVRIEHHQQRGSVAIRGTRRMISMASDVHRTQRSPRRTGTSAQHDASDRERRAEAERRRLTPGLKQKSKSQELWQRDGRLQKKAATLPNPNAFSDSSLVALFDLD
jgi:hypothetical protein